MAAAESEVSRQRLLVVPVHLYRSLDLVFVGLPDVMVDQFINR